MILSTENAGGLVGGSNNTTGTAVEVRMLIGTRVESLGRDAKVGEVVTISQKDASFLLPYGYATRDLVEVAEADEPVDTDETNEATESGDDVDNAELVEDEATDEEADSTDSTVKRTGKRQS